MAIDDIKNMTDLYEYVKADKIQCENSAKKVLQYEAEWIKKKQYNGNLAFIKKMIANIYPLRYILAWRNYREIVSFRSKDLRHKLSKLAKEDILSNIDKYEQTYELLDKESKVIYIYMLCYRLTGDYTFSIRVQSLNEQYFSDRVIWENIETVVDCGAYIGDTLLAFLKHKINIKNYYMYELDDDNYAKARGTCQLAKSKGIKVYPKKTGVFSYTGTLFFKSAADSSMLVDYPTEMSVPIVSIDEDISDKVDFIKMDIEGSELEAIEGARETIKRDKPVLAICIYHKQEDFWKIPLRIKEICPEYQKFWIEQYSPWDIETVLFAMV